MLKAPSCSLNLAQHPSFSTFTVSPCSTKFISRSYSIPAKPSITFFTITPSFATSDPKTTFWLTKYLELDSFYSFKNQLRLLLPLHILNAITLNFAIVFCSFFQYILFVDISQVKCVKVHSVSPRMLLRADGKSWLRQHLCTNCDSCFFPHICPLLLFPTRALVCLQRIWATFWNCILLSPWGTAHAQRLPNANIYFRMTQLDDKDKNFCHGMNHWISE